jgi:hypothetical protein
MFPSLSRRTPQRSAPTAAFTITGSFTAYGRTVSQVQYVTDQFVITKVDRGVFVFIPERDERFLAEPASNRLTRLEPNVQRIQADKLKAVIGEIDIRVEDGEIEVNGFRCRRYRFNSSTARIVIAGETLATRLPGLEATALHREREHDARTQPFSLPLEPDQLVVQSAIRTVASQFDQNQRYQLDSIDEGIEEIERFQQMVSMRVVG